MRVVFRRNLVLLLCVTIPLCACEAFGNLTTGAMTTTNRAAGLPATGPQPTP